MTAQGWERRLPAAFCHIKRPHKSAFVPFNPLPIIPEPLKSSVERSNVVYGQHAIHTPPHSLPTGAISITMHERSERHLPVKALVP